MVKKKYFLAMTLALVSCVLMLPVVVQADLKDGLISVWPLDDGTGTTALDKISSNHGDVKGGAAWAGGKFGGALSFDGAADPAETDYVDCGDDASLKPANVSVSAWIKIESYTYYGIIAGFSFDEGSNESGYAIMTDDYYIAGSEPSIAMWLSAPDGESAGSYLPNTNLPATLDDWIHVVGTYDGSTMKIYVNGIGATGTSEVGDIDYQHVTTFKIGVYAAGGWWLPYAGLIDDVGVWGRALTQEEINWLYNGGAGNPVPKPLIEPTPSNGATMVLRNQILSWEPIAGVTPISYDVYYGSDVNDLSPNYDFEQVLDDTTDTSYNPGELDFESTYYWRIDVNEANDLGPGVITTEGFMFSFTTVPPIPVINSETPADVVIDAGEDALFTVEAMNPLTGDDTGMTYEWFKVGDPTVLSTTETLEITDAQIANEGKYYCVVTVTENSKTNTTREAILTIKRLVGYWPFDKSLDDVEGGNTADYTGAKEKYSSGILGDAIDFSGTTSAATISLTTYNNLGWSLSWWDKSNVTAPDNTWESMVANGPVEGFEILESDRLNVVTYSTGFNLTNSWATTGTYPRGEWNHHVLTHEPLTGRCKWYINGLEFADLEGANFDEFDPDLYVGNCKDGSQRYEGLIDELKLYNYSLNAAEAAKIYTDMSGEEVCIGNPEYDFNEDCIVDISDLTVFLEEWLSCNRYPADFCE